MQLNHEILDKYADENGHLLQAHFAKFIGCTKQNVYKMRKKGVIQLTGDGKVDPAAAVSAIERSRDPARAVTSGEVKNEPAADASAAVQSASAPDPLADDKALHIQSNARRQKFLADKAELEFREMSGALVRKDDVEDAMAEAGRRIRDGLDSIVTWSEEIEAAARKDGVSGVRATLKEKIRVLEDMIARSLDAGDGTG
jgi:hypothetical protein